ncbi:MULTISPECIES: cytochrome c oxidase assembly factor Coa1 family protein [unclassified Arsukibacterium]|uniref:cytochrome c oxidase assembly factor Coa1 family protein n=1 Tax=unclassified Arsukibacterium TaxID=2635278 RepID=UPI0025B97255|nr:MULTISPECIES: cytochrome c oxidase assembly factor Coa1 family protein [unclassified Arsukibacterium]
MKAGKIKNMAQEYISGMGKDSVVPEEIKGWNWGAFLLNWIWGIGNSTFIALLMLVPLVNLVMIFVLGAKGNEWAWRNRTWRDVAHFKSTQRKWRNAGFVLIFIILPVMVMPLMSIMKGEAYDLSVKAVQANSQVISLVGENPEPGFFVLGQITYRGTGGSANLNYSIKGTKSGADVYVYATSSADQWQLKELLVIDKKTGERVIVLTQSE